MNIGNYTTSVCAANAAADAISSMNSRGRQRQRLNWDGLRKSLTLRLYGCFTESSDSWPNFVSFVAALLYGTLKFLSTGHRTILPPILELSTRMFGAPWGIGLHSAPRISMKRCPNPSGISLENLIPSRSTKNLRWYQSCCMFFFDLWQGSRMLERLTQNDSMYI